MNICNTPIPDLLLIDNFSSSDNRGNFIKTFNYEDFLNNNIDFQIKESYYSISKKNVIRGMHFQLPPYDHKKIVYVTEGEILDVIIDLRKKSPTYKRIFSTILSATNKKSIFIPRGCAHGFKSLKNNTITVYNVSSEYNYKSDTGIRYDSIMFDWDTINPIISNRDNSFEPLENFNSPF
tara:strand:- start:1640 stop:2176 length:537 start_codon:yes stop_codon:yes gene_type:complete